MSDAHESIRNLLGRYCELMDGAEWADLGALFTHARLVEEHGHLVAEGADGVRRLYEGGTQLHDGRPGTRHVTARRAVALVESAR